MSNIFNYGNVVFDSVNGIEKEYRSVVYLTPSLPLNLKKTKVGADEVYRPDKISYRLYGDPLLSWVIDEANGFYNGFSDYYIGREIKYPSTEALSAMGITSLEE